MAKYRNWCFTLNNYSIDEIKTFRENTRWKYLLLGYETSETGTPHIQGYVVMKSRCRMRTMKNLNARAHWEPARGSFQQNYDYCTKDGEFTDFGIKPRTQKECGDMEKQRWKDALAAAKDGRLDDIPADIRFRYYTTCKQIMKDFMPMPDDMPNVTGVWIYGPAGVGKSRKAREDYPNAYIKPCNKWWDGYQGQENVIIDDVDKRHEVLGHHLKIWADRYGFTAEIKGGALNCRPSKIVVTSQYSIDDIWPDCETREALKRRFHVVHMSDYFGRKP